MAQIVIYLDDEDKDMIENVAKFTDIDSTSKFCKMIVLKRARELYNTEEYKVFYEKKKNNEVEVCNNEEEI